MAEIVISVACFNWYLVCSANLTIPEALYLATMSAVVACKFHPDATLIEDYRAGDQICSGGYSFFPTHGIIFLRTAGA